MTRRFLIRGAVAGTLMGIAFLHPLLWWSAVLGLAVLIRGADGEERRISLFWYGTLAGTVKMLLVFSALWAVYPLDWLGEFHRALQVLGVGLVWIISSIAIGASLGFFMVAVGWLKKNAYRYLLIPSALVLAEILGSLFFSVLMLGPGSAPNINFSIGYCGYTLAGHNVLGLAALGMGVYMLSLVVCVLALLLISCLRYHRGLALPDTQNRLLHGAVVFLILATYSVSHPLMAVPPVRTVAAITTQFPNLVSLDQGERAVRVQMLIEAFEQALRGEGEVIVFPETAAALRVLGTQAEVFEYVRGKTSRDVVIVDSDRVPRSASESVIRAVVYDTAREETVTAYKEYLVPNGEYLPYTVKALMTLLGYGEVAEVLDGRLAYVGGGVNHAQAGARTPGVLFCSESLSPFHAWRVARDAGIPLIVHPVSHAWFTTPDIFSYQLDLMLRTQVRMAHTPLVEAINMGEARAYNAYGFPQEGKTVWESASTSVVEFRL
jgi:apolipoprotein N-acyltransferase